MFCFVASIKVYSGPYRNRWKQMMKDQGGLPRATPGAFPLSTQICCLLNTNRCRSLNICHPITYCELQIVVLLLSQLLEVLQLHEELFWFSSSMIVGRF